MKLFKRRRKNFDEITEAETATPIGIHSLLVEIRDLFRMLWRAVKIIIAAAVVLIVVAFALQLQVSSRNEDIHQTKVTATEAKDAAREAKQAVEDAVRQSQGGDVDVAKLVAGLNAMTRVEEYICGGPCPTTEGN